ncbi:hypothetical protein BGZ98_000440 [Dissophora globulifera]|uniref:Stress-response A/B barrel domain-containing protein n=1 Tax=Dissophora globulifera TaxID=979702 RepID=A0A9P6R8I6_9FUNG|nr:hypothetical protein BGZ98_000440 [Dissophora globulifera]KAG0314738.1 hypothetical protein BGZ99_007881 [Dissophora globulifera]
MAIAHLVLLKFKPSISEEKAQEILKSLADLREKLPVQSVHAGTNFTHRNQGFTHAFTMIFKSKEDLETYTLAEVHQDIAKNQVHPNVDNFLAIDYEVADYSYPRI